MSVACSTVRPSSGVGREAEETPRIELLGVTKRFPTREGKDFTAIKDVTLSVQPGQFCAVVGPTGCGKSTTLSLVSGLDRPTAGTVRVNEKPVTGIVPGQASCSNPTH